MNFSRLFPIGALVFAYSLASLVPAVSDAQQTGQLIHTGKLAKLKEHLEANPDQLNEKDQAGNSPLMIALMNQKQEIAKYLIEQGAELDEGNKSDLRPLHASMMYRMDPITKILIEKGVDVNAIDTKYMRYTPLNYAISYSGQDSEIIDLLLENGADPSKGGNVTPFSQACQYGYSKLLKKFLDVFDDKSKLNEFDKTGYAPIHWAYLRGDLETIKIIESIDEVDRELLTNNGRNILHVASQSNNIENIKQAATRVKDINAITNNGESALSLATTYGVVFCKTLLELGADPNLEGCKFPPLYRAAQSGQKEVCELLLENGADPNIACPDSKFTPLHGAVNCEMLAYGQIPKKQIEQIVSALVEKGADVNRKDSAGTTPIESAAEQEFFGALDIMLSKVENFENGLFERDDLLHWAAGNGLVNLLNLYAEKANHKFDVDILNRDLQTPIAVSIASGKPELVKFFVDHVADTKQVDEGGHTLLHETAWSGNREICKLLLRSGCQVNQASNTGSSPLHAAVWHDNMQVFQCLLENGADVNAKDSDGQVPLHKAAHQGRIQMVKLLVNKGADISIKDEFGYDAISKARSQKHDEVVEFLSRQ